MIRTDSFDICIIDAYQLCLYVTYLSDIPVNFISSSMSQLTSRLPLDNFLFGAKLKSRSSIVN
jgi:hypothetical protein